ncbi:MAG: DegT/DnrJ/EryC1/StrS family aminotransferase [Candidatus Velthaea sp.]
MIPILDLTEQYQALKNEIDTAVQDVFAGGHFIIGPNVKAFETEFAAFTGAPHAAGLNSGTDALHIALRALDVGPGDEVITTPFTFVATTEAIGIVGARPVFVDIDPATFNIDPALIEAAITPRTKAILPVHLYGAPAPMTEIMAIARKHNLAVVEDCAQSVGAAIGDKQTGTFGAAGCYSFFPSKNLGAFGDGGMLTTQSEALMARSKAIRAHGGRVKYYHEEIGVNSRLDEVQAAILRVKLPHLARWTLARRAVAERYRTLLADVPGVVAPQETPGTTAVYHQFTIRVSDRDDVQAELQRAGVQTMVYYPVPLHLQAVHANLGYAEGSFPHAERAAREVLSLPMFPELRPDVQQRVVDAVREATGALALS